MRMWRAHRSAISTSSWSTDEKVEIASVGKFYEFMVDTLRNIPKK